MRDQILESFSHRDFSIMVVGNKFDLIAETNPHSQVSVNNIGSIEKVNIERLEKHIFQYLFYHNALHNPFNYLVPQLTFLYGSFHKCFLPTSTLLCYPLLSYCDISPY